MFLNKQVPRSHLSYYLVILAGMCAVILSALAFEHLGGYQPCKLCLQQREPWYLGIPIALLASLSLAMQWPACVTRGLMLVVGLILVYSTVLGIHHSGVEWGWWEGPNDCGVVDGGLAETTSGLLEQLQQAVPPSCNDAALRVLGLSFAGWNAFASIVLAAIAIRSALRGL